MGGGVRVDRYMPQPPPAIAPVQKAGKSGSWIFEY